MIQVYNNFKDLIFKKNVCGWIKFLFYFTCLQVWRSSIIFCYHHNLDGKYNWNKLNTQTSLKNLKYNVLGNDKLIILSQLCSH